MDVKKIFNETKVWAVIGVTLDKEKFGYKIYSRLKEINKKVYGVTKVYDHIDGDKMYKSLSQLPEKPDTAVFVVNPKIGLYYVKECSNLSIKTIWLQPGTYDDELIDLINKLKLFMVKACVLIESK